MSKMFIKGDQVAGNINLCGAFLPVKIPYVIKRTHRSSQNALSTNPIQLMKAPATVTLRQLKCTNRGPATIPEDKIRSI